MNAEIRRLLEETIHALPFAGHENRDGSYRVTVFKVDVLDAIAKVLISPAGQEAPPPETQQLRARAINRLYEARTVVAQVLDTHAALSDAYEEMSRAIAEVEASSSPAGHPPAEDPAS